MIHGPYGEEHIRGIIGDAAERIDAAMFDPEGWGDFIDYLGEAFPGACVSWASFAPDGLTRTVATGWDPNAIAAYEAYYATTNPFAGYWAALPPHSAVVAGRDAPAIGSYENTEFVADWLDPQGDLRGAAGIRVGSTADPVVTFISTHYPTAQAKRYDTGFAMVLDALSDRISTAQHMLASMVRSSELAVDRAALLERQPAAAFVVSPDGTIRDLSSKAYAMVRARDLLASAGRGPGAGEKLMFREPGLQRWFESAMARARIGMRTSDGRAFATPQGTVRIRLARLPGAQTGPFAATFGTERLLVLVDVRPHGAAGPEAG